MVIAATAPFIPDTVRPQVDSNAPLIVSLQLRLFGYTRFLNINAPNVVQGFQINLRAGVATGSINLFFAWERQTWQYPYVRDSYPPGELPGLRQWIITSRSIPGIGSQVRLAWNWDRGGPLPNGLTGSAIDGLDFLSLSSIAGTTDDTRTILDRSPLYDLQVVKSTPQFTAAGMGLALEVVGAVLNPTSLQPTHGVQSFNVNGDQVSQDATTAGPRAWDEGKKASEIVTEIAAFYGWPTDIAASKDALPEIRLMANETHIDFIQKRLLPKARDDHDNQFLFYFDTSHNKLHFHPLGASATRSSLLAEVTRAYRVFRDKMGEVISFEPSDTTLFSAIGGTSVIYASFNSETGEPRHQPSAPTTGVESRGPGNLITGYETHTTNVAVPQATTGLGITTAAPVVIPTRLQTAKGRDDTEAEAHATAQYGTLNTLNFRAHLEVRGTHKLEMGKCVLVEYYTASATTHLGDASQLYYLSGIYWTMEVEQRVDSGGWVTSANLLRKGVVPSAGAVDTGALDSPTVSLKPFTGGQAVAPSTTQMVYDP